jgi:di/tricarboxylate transporter
VIGTTLPVQMGVLGLVAAWVVGTGIVGQSVDDIFSYFPGDLFVTLVGVTYLFAIANGNGTVNRLIQKAVQLAGGRVVAIPWVMFLITAVLTGVGSVVPAAVAIIAPIGLGFALAHKINPVLMGLLIINGATAGGVSPLSVFGTIVNQVVERNELPDGSRPCFSAR